MQEDQILHDAAKVLRVSVHTVEISKDFYPPSDLSQIITPNIIDNRHLIAQNSSIITYFFNKYIQDQ
jgi:hypothetical protein